MMQASYIPGLFPYEVSNIGRSIAGAADNSAVRTLLGLAVADSPTFAGATFSGNVLQTQPYRTIGATAFAMYNSFTMSANAQKWTIGGDYPDSMTIKMATSISSTYQAVFRTHNTPGLMLATASQLHWGVNLYSNAPADVCIGRYATGPAVQIKANGGLRVRNLADSADAPFTAGAGRFSDIVQANKTYVSATNFEAFQIDPIGNASSFDLASIVGSAGGTSRPIRIGHKDAGGTFTSALSIATNEAATFSGQITNVPPASVTLATNGQFSIEMTSNTAGNLVYRGSDGTTRRAALTFV